MKNIFKKNNSQGFAGIIALLTVCSLVLILTLSLGASLFAKKQISKNLLNSFRSYYLAESGIEDAVYRKIKGLNLPSGISNLDGVNVSQTLTTNGDTTTIDSVASYANNYRKLRILLRITTSDVSFHYGVQVGEGGLSMENGAVINGNLYSDGSVSGQSTTAMITGDMIVATGMTLDNTKGKWETYSTDATFNKNPAIDIAVSYTPSLSGKLSQVAFYLKRTSNTPPDGTIRIVTNNTVTSSPSTILVSPTATATFTASKIGESYGWVNYSFSNPPSLVADTTYWIVIDVNTSPNKYFYIGTSPGNANSVSKHSTDFSGGSWTLEAAGDYEFRAWIGGVVTSINSVTVGGNAQANTINGSIVGGDAYASNIIENTTVGRDAYADVLKNTSIVKRNSFALNVETSKICGDAHYKTIDASSTSFLNAPTLTYCANPLTNGTGIVDNTLVAPADPAVVAMPLSQGNITDWETTAVTGENLDSFCTSDSADMILNAGVMNCDFKPTHSKPVITLNGIVWVKGDIVLPPNSIIQLSGAYGATSGIIIADHPTTPETKGIIDTGNGTLVCGSQGYNPGASPTCKASNGSYIMLLSTYSSLASNAIEISNNASGAIYYASRGIAKVNNNASNVKEVTAYKLLLANGASITYESGLANASFSTGPGGGWAINSWKETE